MNLIRASCILLLYTCLPLAQAAMDDQNSHTPAMAGAGASIAPSPQTGATAPAQAPGRAPENGLYARFPHAAPSTLEQLRGGSDALASDSIASDTRLQGATTGNSATHVVTGHNVIQSGSFANAAGVPVVIQNSGANVLIQNATVVNLQFQ
jgi:hypothetical protein